MILLKKEQIQRLIPFEKEPMEKKEAEQCAYDKVRPLC